MKKFVLITILFGLSVTISEARLRASTDYNLVKISQANGAACLDGSAPGFYISQGTGEIGQSNFIVYFEGGGWCGQTTYDSTVNSCYQRSNTDLGSSNNYYPNVADIGGILSSNTNANPQFAAWTKVFIKYCDGTGHQGYRKDPVMSSQGKNLYFRGFKNTEGIFQTLKQNYGLGNAKKLLILGCSAGGLAAYTWANWIKDFMPATTSVFVAPDSGFFLDYANNQTGEYRYRTQIQNFMAISNVEIDPVNTDCVNAFQTQKWRCLFAENLIKFIQIPLFYIQPQYDTWSMPNILGLGCFSSQGELSTCDSQSLDAITAFRLQQVLKAEESFTKNKNWGAWMPACLNHCYTSGGYFNSGQFNVPMNSGFSITETLSGWMEGKSSPYEWKNIDISPWPSNTPCSSQ